MFFAVFRTFYLAFCLYSFVIFPDTLLPKSMLENHIERVCLFVWLFVCLVFDCSPISSIIANDKLWWVTSIYSWNILGHQVTVWPEICCRKSTCLSSEDGSDSVEIGGIPSSTSSHLVASPADRPKFATRLSEFSTSSHIVVGTDFFHLFSWFKIGAFTVLAIMTMTADGPWWLAVDHGHLQGCFYNGNRNKTCLSDKLPSLVGGLEHFLFLHILGIIIRTDFHIFQRGRYTTSQFRMVAHVFISS